MDVGDIIKEYLEKNNFYGLFQSDECSCTVDDLFPCGNVQADCIPGIRLKCKGCKNEEECPHGIDKDGYDFCIGYANQEFDKD